MRERGSAGLVKDLEVSAVVENAATRTGEDAPVQAGRILLEMLAQERDQLWMDGYWPRLAAGAVLELAALPGRAAVGPPGAAAQFGASQEHLAPAFAGQACKILRAQFDGFFGRIAA